MYSTSCFVVLFATAYSGHVTLVPYLGINIIDNNANYHLSVQNVKRTHELPLRNVAPSLTLVLAYPHDKWTEQEEIPRRPLQKTLRFTDYAVFLGDAKQLYVYYSGEFARNSYGVGVLFNQNVTPSTFGRPFYSLADEDGKEYFIEHTQLTSPPSDFILVPSSEGLTLFYKFTDQERGGHQIGSIWLNEDGTSRMIKFGRRVIPNPYFKPNIKKFWVLERNYQLVLITDIGLDLLCATKTNIIGGQMYEEHSRAIGSTKTSNIEDLMWDRDGWPYSKVPPERPQEIDENMWPTVCGGVPNFND